MDELTQRVRVQLRRLYNATEYTSTQVHPDEVLAAVAESCGVSDNRVARQRGMRNTMFSRYREQVIGALMAASNSDGAGVNGHGIGEERYRVVECLDSYRRERYDLIERRLEAPGVAELLERMPHVVELIRSFQERGDVTELLDETGVPYRSRRVPNDAMKGFVLGGRRPGTQRTWDGVGGVATWARRMVLKRWLDTRQTYWGGEDANAKISRLAARIMAHEPAGKRGYIQERSLARQFFERVLAKDFQDYSGAPAPIREDFFPGRFESPANGFGEVDVGGSYKSYAKYSQVPDGLVAVVEREVAGATRSEAAQLLPRIDYYHPIVVRSWIECGLLVVERALLSKGRRVGIYELEYKQEKVLREVKRRMMEVE